MEKKKSLDERHVTVGRLKEILSRFDDDLLVYTEGCDCWGPCGGAEVEAVYGGQVLLVGRNDDIEDFECSE